MAVTTVYGVLGSPIAHSLSPVMHNAAFAALDLDAAYIAFDVDKQRAETAMRGARALGFGGLNITFPLKEAALHYCKPDALSKRIGAVNTVDRAGTGYNTDGVGAVRALEEAGVSVKDASILLLGAGGAAKAIAAQLLLNGARGTRCQSDGEQVAHLGPANDRCEHRLWLRRHRGTQPK